MKKTILLFMGIFCAFLAAMPLQAKEQSQKIETKLLLEYTEEIGELYGIDAYLLYAICEAESSLNIYAENGSCKGLMQVSEKWHTDRMEELGVDDLFDPYGNILVAADYLAELYAIKDDTYYVLMRYNMKKSTADELYANGKISYYAKSIVERANELKNMDQIIEQRTNEAVLDPFLKGGVTLWMQ